LVITGAPRCLASSTSLSSTSVTPSMSSSMIRTGDRLRCWSSPRISRPRLPRLRRSISAESATCWSSFNTNRGTSIVLWMKPVWLMSRMRPSMITLVSSRISLLDAPPGIMRSACGLPRSTPPNRANTSWARSEKTVMLMYAINAAATVGRNWPNGSGSSDSGHAKSAATSIPKIRPNMDVTRFSGGIWRMMRRAVWAGYVVSQGVIINPASAPVSEKVRPVASGGSDSASARSTPSRTPNNAHTNIAARRSANSRLMDNFS